MNGNVQAALSAARSVLIVIGTLAATMGWVSNEKMQAVLQAVDALLPPLAGALLVIGPLIWGMVNKYRAAGKVVDGVNAGIALSNAAPGNVTPPVPKEAVPAIIKEFKEAQDDNAIR